MTLLWQLRKERETLNMQVIALHAWIYHCMCGRLHICMDGKMDVCIPWLPLEV